MHRNRHHLNHPGTHCLKPSALFLLAGAFLISTSATPPASADTFQRIRTFEPGRGLVAGSGNQSGSTSQNASQATTQTSNQSRQMSGRPTQVASSNSNNSNTDAQSGDERSTDERKHHKHHHKFLFFGHHDDENVTSENDANAASDVEPPRESFTPARPNNTLFTPNSKIQQAPQTNSASAYNNSTISMPVVMPRSSPQVAPPEPRQRPSSPMVDPGARLPVVQNGGAKPSLAWRTRAYRLAIEPEDTASLSKHPSRILNCSIEEALNAVADCCKSKGAQIVGQSYSAGQIGARFTDPTAGKSLIVFVAKSVGSNRTMLKASAESDRAQKVALVNDLITQAAAIIDGKGLL